MAQHTILIVDDEEAIREVVRMALEAEGFRCIEAAEATAAHAAAIDAQPDLMLLDWMMPKTSGIELLRRLRNDGACKSLPVIMLTARADEDNRVQGLDVGADDYLTKPFSNRELIARIKAVLRRGGAGAAGEAIEFGGLRMDIGAQRLFAGDSEIKLKPLEFKILHFFMANQERAFSRAQLLDQVWGGNVYVEDRTVDVHIRRLRKALDTERGDFGSMIQTVRGTGYRLSTMGSRV